MFILCFKKPAALIDAYVVENAELAAVNGLYTLVEDQTSYGDRKVYSNGSYKLGFLNGDDDWFGWSINDLNRSFVSPGGPNGWAIYYGPELDNDSTIGPETTNGNWLAGGQILPNLIIRQANVNDIPTLDREGTILTVSGCVNGGTTSSLVNQSTLMNGNYYLIDKTATGIDRIWKHETEEYYIRYIATAGQTKWRIVNRETGIGTSEMASSVYLNGVETANDPYQSDGSSYTTWYYVSNPAPHINISATNI